MSDLLGHRSYSAFAFAEAVGDKNRYSEKERKRAFRAVQMCEQWASERPPELAFVAEYEQPADSRISDAQAACLKYVKKSMAPGIIGTVVWVFVVAIIRAVVYLWVKELFFSREMQRAIGIGG